ncbi:MAG: sugar phosphate nucleotidyltransferase [Acidobacteriota bacterium]|nr:sugar phosphate nucleotidyltransferase [Acidobacteriota bacterium]
MSIQNQSIAKRDGHPGSAAAEAPPERVALLLAGGDGMRLREFTCEIAGIPIPKQYCRLLHGASLLEASISRVHLLFPHECINVVVNEDHLDLAREQVKSLPDANVFVQPRNRDTGPGMVFALFNLERTYGDATVAVFPTDHYIDRNWAFIAHVMRAVHAISAQPDKIGVLGVAPDRPETGYGYILPANPVPTFGKAYEVEAFMEKPNPAVAREIITRGALWNTFVMVFRLSRMLELLQHMVPKEFEILSVLRKAPHRAAEVYQAIAPWNFSTQILSRIPQHLIVFRIANVSWSDWGTRESIERTYRQLKIVPTWKMAKAMGHPIPIQGAVENYLETR